MSSKAKTYSVDGFEVSFSVSDDTLTVFAKEKGTQKTYTASLDNDQVDVLTKGFVPNVQLLHDIFVDSFTGKFSGPKLEVSKDLKLRFVGDAVLGPVKRAIKFELQMFHTGAMVPMINGVKIGPETQLILSKLDSMDGRIVRLEDAVFKNGKLYGGVKGSEIFDKTKDIDPLLEDDSEQVTYDSDALPVVPTIRVPPEFSRFFELSNDDKTIKCIKTTGFSCCAEGYTIYGSEPLTKNERNKFAIRLDRLNLAVVGVVPKHGLNQRFGYKQKGSFHFDVYSKCNAGDVVTTVVDLKTGAISFIRNNTEVLSGKLDKDFDQYEYYPFIYIFAKNAIVSFIETK